MSKSKIFIGVAISFAAGVWLASRFGIFSVCLPAVLAAAIAVFALTFDCKNKTAPVVALFFVAAALGALRLQMTLHPNEYANVFDTKQQLEGYIVEDVDVRQANQFLTVQPKDFDQRILVSASLYSNYFYGDWVVVTGKVKEPQSFDGFDYPMYLQRFNVYATMSYPKILVLKSHRQNLIKEWLLDIKWAFTRRIDQLLSEPQASLLMGILIGARKTLPQDIIDNFNATGVSHIIAISGYNITIIASGLAFLANALGRRARLWVTLTVVCGFVVMSGASASVVRAAIMGGLVLLAGSSGRQYAVGPALFCAGLIMLVINPRILYWDASFQLSFLATLGIVYFEPLFENLTARFPNPFNIKSTLLVTMSAILATLPIIVYLFGRLSAVAPVVNILILPIVPLAMLLGFLTVLPWVGAGFAFAVNILLKYILNVTAAFAHLPYGNFAVKISEYEFAALALTVLCLYVYLSRLVSRRLSREAASSAAIPDI